MHRYFHPNCSRWPWTIAALRDAPPKQHTHRCIRPRHSRWHGTTGALPNVPLSQLPRTLDRPKGNRLFCTTSVHPGDHSQQRLRKLSRPMDSLPSGRTGEPQGVLVSLLAYTSSRPSGNLKPWPTPSARLTAPPLSAQSPLVPRPRLLSNISILHPRKDIRLHGRTPWYAEVRPDDRRGDYEVASLALVQQRPCNAYHHHRRHHRRLLHTFLQPEPALQGERHHCFRHREPLVAKTHTSACCFCVTHHDRRTTCALLLRCHPNIVRHVGCVQLPHGLWWLVIGYRFEDRLLSPFFVLCPQKMYYCQCIHIIPTTTTAVPHIADS